MRSTPRTGLHNPLRDVGRYTMLGDVMARGAAELRKPEVREFFTKLIQRLVAKSWAQCEAEPVVVRKWLTSHMVHSHTPCPFH